MLTCFIHTIKDIFKSPSLQENLEKYISSQNPQSFEDIDRLEREFYRRKTAITTFPFYHE